MAYKTEFGKVSETVIDHKERLSFDRSGALRFSSWHFEKRKVYKNSEGEVRLELPIKETLFLISKGNIALWLRPEEIRDLKNMLEAQQELAFS